MGALHVGIHAEPDAGVLHAEAEFAQVVLEHIAVGNAGKICPDTAAAGMASIHRSEIHESDWSDRRGTDPELEWRLIVLWNGCGSSPGISCRCSCRHSRGRRARR